MIDTIRPLCGGLLTLATAACPLLATAQADPVSCSASITSIAYGTADVLLDQAIDTTSTLDIPRPQGH
jgi:hypothetical protein